MTLIAVRNSEILWGILQTHKMSVSITSDTKPDSVQLKRGLGLITGCAFVVGGVIGRWSIFPVLRNTFHQINHFPKFTKATIFGSSG